MRDTTARRRMQDSTARSFASRPGRLPRDGHASGAALARVCAVAASMSCACRYPATEVVVTIATDAPIDRDLVVTARAVRADATAAVPVMLVHRAAGGVDPLPASFAVITGGASPDEPVTLTIEATVASDGTSPAAVLRRTARFRFVPHVRAAVPFFLPMRCGDQATDCARTPAAECTIAARCEELGQTCGDQGECVPIDVTPVPVPADATVPGPDVTPPPRDATVPRSDAGTPDVRDASDASDARDASDAPDAPDARAYGPWGTPVPVTSVNTAVIDMGPAVTPDELEIYFTSNRAGGMGGDDLWVARRANRTDPFGPATPLTELNSPTEDSGPDISPDALRIVFQSDRAGGFTVMEATRVRRTDPFGAPRCVLSSCATYGRAPALSPDGLRMYYGVGTPTMQLAFASRASVAGAFGAATILAALNSSADDGWPTIASDELTILFQSTRPGMGGADIYLSTRADRAAPFVTPVAVGAVNSPRDDGSPYLTADGTALYFESNRAGGAGALDIWVARRPLL